MFDSRLATWRREDKRLSITNLSEARLSGQGHRVWSEPASCSRLSHSKRKTRAVGLLTYEQGVEAFRVTDQLSDSERSALMGGTLVKIYNWSPDMGG